MKSLGRMKKLVRYVSFLLSLTIAISAFAVEPLPHNPTFCAGLLRTAAQNKGDLAGVLYSLRDFRWQLEGDLKAEMSRRRGLKDMTPKNLLLRSLVRKHADTSQNNWNVDSIDPRQGPIFELHAKREIGRLTQLESDIVTENQNHLSATYQIRGKQNIEQFIDGVSKVNQEIESIIGPEVNKKFPFEQNRLHRYKRFAASAFLTMAVYFEYHVLVALIHHHGANLITASNLLWAAVWARELKTSARELSRYVRAEFSRNAQIEIENEGADRAVMQIQTLNAIKDDLNTSSPSTRYEYVGWTLNMTPEMMKLLANDSQTNRDYFAELAMNAELARRNLVMEDSAAGLFDIIYYHDSTTGEPVLLVTSRLMRGMVPPTTPKKKEKKQKEKATELEGNLAPAPSGA